MSLETAAEQYGGLEKNELLKNREAIELFLEFGKKWGVFMKLSNTQRTYRYPGGVDSLGFFVHEIVQEHGPEEARKILESIDAQTKLAQKGELDLKAFKTAVVAAQREKLKRDKQKASESSDAGELRGIAFEERMLQVSETDLKKGSPITLQSLNALSPSELPSWVLVILNKQLLPEEIESMVKEKDSEAKDAVVESTRKKTGTRAKRTLR